MEKAKWDDFGETFYSWKDATKKCPLFSLTRMTTGHRTLLRALEQVAGAQGCSWKAAIQPHPAVEEGTVPSKLKFSWLQAIIQQ